MMLRQQTLSFSTAHATLKGDLSLPTITSGIAIFVAACSSHQHAEEGGIAGQLHASGIGTLTLELLIGNECNFADAEVHLPQLAERLLAALTQLRRMMDSEAIPEVPLALIATGDATPLAVRVAALRDQDVKAIICHGGLVDLAGLQYLKVLRAPLLMIAAADDTRAITNLQRAKEYIPSIIGLERLDLADMSAEAAEAASSQLTIDWLQRYLH